MALRTELVDSTEDLQTLEAAWDALAVASGRPLAAPAWALAWWRAAAPEGARLATVAVHEGDALVALAPLYLEAGPLRRLRALGAAVSARVQPLAVEGRSREAAGEIARALAALRPGALLLEAQDDRSHWTHLLAGAWPGGARVSCDRVGHAPRINTVQANLDEWYAGLSSNTRGMLRRRRRRLAEQGATFGRVSDHDELHRALDAFAVQHAARWADEGGSGVVDAAVERMLHAAAPAMSDADRLRVHAVRLEGGFASVQIFVAAGDEVTFWLGGYDARWAKLSPGLHPLVDAVEECLARGESGLDLGYGEQDYKLRIADARDRLRWFTLAPMSARGLLAAGTARGQSARRSASERLPDDLKTRLKRLRGSAVASRP